MLFRFEDMKKDQKSAIHQVCDFLDVQLTEEMVIIQPSVSF